MTEELHVDCEKMSDRIVLRVHQSQIIHPAVNCNGLSCRNYNSTTPQGHDIQAASTSGGQGVQKRGRKVAHFVIRMKMTFRRHK